MQNRNLQNKSVHYLTKWGVRILCLILLTGFALTTFQQAAHAQIVGDLEFTVPFSFHAGDAKLPAGTYRVHVLDNEKLSVMEISSADGSVSALFDVNRTEANATPAKSEVIFNRYGNRYFLSTMYNEGETTGTVAAKSRYEKRLISAEPEAQVAQLHVPARRRTA